MNAILKEDPPEFAASGANVPMALDRVVPPMPREESRRAFPLGARSGAVLGRAPGRERRGKRGFDGRCCGSHRRGLGGCRGFWPWVRSRLAAAAYLAGHRLATPAAVEVPAYHRLTFRRGHIYSARYAGDGKTFVYSAIWGKRSAPAVHDA